MLGIVTKVLSKAPKNAKFDNCATKLKYSIEKPMLLKFMDLSKIYCPRIQLVELYKVNVNLFSTSSRHL